MNKDFQFNGSSFKSYENLVKSRVLSAKDANDAVNGAYGIEKEVILNNGEKQKKELFKILIEKWINTSLEGVSKASSNGVAINDLMARSHFTTVMNLFKGQGIESIRQYQLSMSVKGLHQYLRKMETFIPFFFNQDMKTNKGNVLNIKQNKQGRWYIPNSGDKAIANQKVTVNLLMAFENEAARETFEKSLSKHPSGNLPSSALKELEKNIIEVTGTVFDEADIDRMSSAITRNKRWLNVADNSIGCLLSGINVYFQVTGLSSIEKQLASSEDDFIRLITKAKLLTSYSTIIMQSMESLVGFTMAAASASSFFSSKASSLYTCLSKPLNKISTIGKQIALVDSVLTLFLAMKSFNQGNTGSGVYVATSFMSLCLSLGGLVFAIPVWGQIALVLVGIAFVIINVIYYSDGSDWDELDKWLNRSMLGNFDHKDMYPPYYLPTPVCMQLSKQDYYLAITGGVCKVELDSGFFDSMVTYNDLYLQLNLPDFNDKKAEFEGKVIIKKVLGATAALDYDLNKKQQPSLANCSTELYIAHGGNKLTINPSQPLDIFTPAINQSLNRKKERYSMDEKESLETSEDEKLWNELMAIATKQPLPTVTSSTQNSDNLSDNKVGLFLIKQRLGKIKGWYEVMVRVNYWPNGKKDEKGNEITPYLLTHHYRKTS